MRSSLFALALFLSIFIACSKNQPAPVGPAGKTSTSNLRFPANLKVEAITKTSARLRWDSVDNATDYDIAYKKIADGKWRALPHIGTDTTASLSRLEPGTEYRWTVKTNSGQVQSRWALGVNFTTLTSSPSPQPPDPPSSNISINPTENHAASEDTTETAPDDPFNIELIYVDDFSVEEQQVIKESAYEWEQHIRAGFPDRGNIDDLRILIRRNTWASGSPCTDSKACVTLEGLRANSYIPYEAILYIDLEPPWGYRDYIWMKQADKDYQRYITTHEIGHALGLVGLYSVAHQRGLIHDSEDNDPYGIGGQPYFSGQKAQQIFQEALSQSPAAYTGRGVPLDVRTLLRPAGQPDYRGPEHWPMKWLGTSVMADGSFGSSGKSVTQQGRLVTQLDLAVLADLGYQVNLTEARPIEIGYYGGFQYSPSADRKTGVYSWEKLISPNQASAGKATIPTSWCGNH